MGSTSININSVRKQKARSSAWMKYLVAVNEQTGPLAMDFKPTKMCLHFHP